MSVGVIGLLILNNSASVGHFAHGAGLCNGIKAFRMVTEQAQLAEARGAQHILCQSQVIGRIEVIRPTYRLTEREILGSYAAGTISRLTRLKLSEPILVESPNKLLIARHTPAHRLDNAYISA